MFFWFFGKQYFRSPTLGRSMCSVEVTSKVAIYTVDVTSRPKGINIWTVAGGFLWIGVFLWIAVYTIEIKADLETCGSTLRAAKLTCQFSFTIRPRQQPLGSLQPQAHQKQLSSPGPISLKCYRSVWRPDSGLRALLSQTLLFVPPQQMPKPLKSEQPHALATMPTLPNLQRTMCKQRKNKHGLTTLGVPELRTHTALTGRHRAPSLMFSLYCFRLLFTFCSKLCTLQKCLEKNVHDLRMTLQQNDDNVMILGNGCFHDFQCTARLA